MSFTVPFGDREQSGFGRENGLDAIDEFLQSKSVWIHVGEETPDPFSRRQNGGIELPGNRVCQINLS